MWEVDSRLAVSVRVSVAVAKRGGAMQSAFLERAIRTIYSWLKRWESSSTRLSRTPVRAQDLAEIGAELRVGAAEGASTE